MTVRRLLQRLVVVAAAGALFHCPAPRAPEAGGFDGSLEGTEASASESIADGALDTGMPSAAPADASVTADGAVFARSPDAASGDAHDAARVADAAKPHCSRVLLGQSAAIAGCTRHDQCTLRVPGCCPPCGMVSPGVVRAASTTALAPVCKLACPACVSAIPRRLGAECIKQRCVVVETRCDNEPTNPLLRELMP